MSGLLLLVLSMLSAAEIDIVLPVSSSPVRLRVIARQDSHSAVLTWSNFLDQLFRHFDRNSDGTLSAEEARRVFSLPLPDGRTVPLKFEQLDANRDGRGTLDEFKAYYRQAGFGPIVVAVQPATAEQQRLSQALFRHLDRNGDGTLSVEEWKRATSLLSRLDANEDEVLDAEELLALETKSEPALAAKSGILIEGPRGAPEGVLWLASGKEALKLQPLTARIVAEQRGFTIEGNRLQLQAPMAEGANRFRGAKEFYLAQFGDALGNKKALRLTDLEADAGLQAIAAMFDAADRNGDGQLSLAELQAFLDLIERGLTCQAVVTLEDRGRNLFDLLDTNRDTRLDLAELFAANRLTDLKQGQVPSQFRLGHTRGIPSSSFGPVPIPKVKQPLPKTTSPTLSKPGPRWFRSMDHNNDGFLSLTEFLGTPTQFKQLDQNGDGRISVEEAEAKR